MAKEKDDDNVISKSELDALIAKAVEKANGEHKVAIDAVQKKLDDAVAERDAAIAKSKMSDAERAYMDDEKDEKKKKKFLDMNADERKQFISKRNEGDETIEVGGRTIRKSIVGEDTFAVFKAQQDQINASKLDVEKARGEARTTRLEKRASDEFPHVKGKSNEIAKVLGHMESAPEDVRKVFDEIMKSAEEMAQGAFTSLGVGDGRTRQIDKAAKQPFETKVSEIMKRDKLNRMKALQKAREEFPEEFEAFQAAGRPEERAVN